MKKRTDWFPLIIFLVLLIVLALPANASAQQSYRFSVEKEVVNVYWNSDGTSSIDYVFTFSNQPGAHVIDFVDVGMPNGNFDINTAKADVDGKSVAVSRSDYQGGGSGFVAVLGSQSIQAGKMGTVHIYIGRVEKVLYPDDNDEKYASAVFAPTWFSSRYVFGNTDLTVIFHLPPGVKPDEPRWHSSLLGFSSVPQTGFDSDGRITYTWNNSDASASRRYKFGVSFPKTYVPDNTISAPMPEQEERYDVGKIISYLALLGFILLCIPIARLLTANRRKLKYLPPKISIEGHGIKRGLTAVEVAMLIQTPLDKVMTMILFGLIKKGAAEVTKRTPLMIKPSDHLPEGLHQYELDFLKAFETHWHDENDVLVRDRRKNALEEMIVHLIRSVSEKMRCFSRKETVDFYKNIVEKAWRQTQEADTPKVKMQTLDENFEWMMLDRSFDRRAQRAFTATMTVPDWWSSFDPAWSITPAETTVPSASHQHQK